MQIGNIIRKYRLEKCMTQEEVAMRLGVTAPAVNKWEKGRSMPDITLLSPIARLLNISLDTLLSHTDALSQEDAGKLILVAYDRLKTEPFEAVFDWAKALLQTYPNSAFLALYMARTLASHIQMHHPALEEAHAPFFLDCYQRALESEDEGVKSAAADALYYHAMGSGEFEKAEKYLDYFSKENPERKRKQAAVFWEKKRKDEALQMCEELLYAGYQSINLTFHDIYYYALEDENFEKAHDIAEKQRLLSQLFEMGEYHEVSAGLELAIVEKDADGLFEIMQRLLGNIESISGFTKSPLYAHMKLKQPNEDYFNNVRQTLLDCLKGEDCAFIRGDARFENLQHLS